MQITKARRLGRRSIRLGLTDVCPSILSRDLGVMIACTETAHCFASPPCSFEIHLLTATLWLTSPRLQRSAGTSRGRGSHEATNTERVSVCNRVRSDRRPVHGGGHLEHCDSQRHVVQSIRLPSVPW